MRTPSLRGRLVAAGVGVVLVVLVALDVFLFVSLRSSLLENLDEVVDERARLVQANAAAVPAEELPARLTELGLRVTLRGPDGEVLRSDPASTLAARELPAPDGGRQVTRRVPLRGGWTAEVSATRMGVDQALVRLALLEVAGTVVAVGLAALLLLRVSDVALRPLGVVTAAARRTAAGRAGERLRPDRPDTTVGEMAAAYDDMLDTLEAAVREAREAEQRSVRLQERSRQILETANDAYVAIDAEGVVVDWNGPAERTFGWSTYEILGRKATDTIIPPHLRQPTLDAIRQFVETGESPILGRHLELEGLHRDGHVFPVEFTAWVTAEGGGYAFNAFIRDITRRRRDEDAAHHLASLVESSDDGIIAHDLKGRVVSWNRGAERIYGYRAEEMVGRPILETVPADRHGEVGPVIEQISRGESVRLETLRLPKHGPPVEVSLTASPIRDSTGRVVGASIISRDITEQRWISSTLDTTLSALEAALEEARRAEARSRRFLADAAHQLRTPITGIRACAETLLRGPLPADRDRLLADLVREASRAGRLMGSLLQMARLDQGDELAPVSSDLAALCTDEVGRARSLAPELDIVLGLDGVDGVRPELDGDAVREILANLLDNARRHARSRIEVVLARAGDGVEVRVLDDGPGLAPAVSERVFERFVSLDGRGGSGLGLPIARGLARAHGGDLAYEDRAFVLRLPLRARVGSG